MNNISKQLLEDILQINYIENSLKKIDQLTELNKYFDIIISKQQELILRDRDKEFQIISKKYGIEKEISTIYDVDINDKIWVAIYNIDNTNFLTQYYIQNINLDHVQESYYIKCNEIPFDYILDTNLWKYNNFFNAKISFKNNNWKIEYLDKDYQIKIFKRID